MALGTGVVIYYRKEGRALGEVTKYLVYNMRKRQEGGDQAKEYFNCTQHVAGVTDSRFQVTAFWFDVWLLQEKLSCVLSIFDHDKQTLIFFPINIIPLLAPLYYNSALNRPGCFSHA